MKNKLLTGLAMILVLTALGSGSASAQDSDDLRTKVDVGRFPELTVERYGVFQGDNLLDPKSSNYDPSLRYGPDGTRFGPPAKRNLDFYRSMGLVLGEDSLNLEKDRKKGDPWPGEGDYGTIINDGLIIGGQGVSETQAYQKIYTDLYLNGDDKVLYAPSMLAPDYCRLEAVIRYNRDNGTTERHFAIFTHSETTYGDGDWTNVYTLDQGAFQYQYVTGADEVIVKITKSGQESNPLWTVYLYDIVPAAINSLSPAVMPWTPVC